MANKSKPIVISTIFVVIVLAIIAYFVFRPTEKISPAISINTKDQPTIGKADAPIHIVAFEDLKCANCKIYNNTFYPKIKKNYIDTGKAKYTFINLAFIPGSLPVANAARCLYSQNKDFFFPFIEYIYHNQPPEDEDWGTTATLLQFAKAATPKADMNKLSSCMIEGRYNNLINKNLDIAKKAMPEIATPSVYVNGRRLTRFNMQALDQLANMKP